MALCGLAASSTRTHKCFLALRALASCAPVKSDVKPQMRNALFVVALAGNSLFLLLSSTYAMAAGTSIFARLAAAAIALTTLGVISLLGLARFSSPSHQAFQAMPTLCAAGPVLWVGASMDSGIISGFEVVFLLVVGLVAGGSWHVFKLLRASA